MEHNLHDPTSGEEASKNKAKSVLAAAVAVILGLAVIFGLLWLQKSVDKPSDSGNTPTKASTLSLAQKQDLEAQVADLEDQVKKLSAATSAADRDLVYLKLASAKYQLGDHDAAIAALDQIIAENQNNARVWALYAVIYKDKGDLEKAREKVKRAVDLEPENEGHWLMYLDLSRDRGNDSLRLLYEEALNKTGNNIAIVIAYARFLEKIGDKPGAIAQWQKAAQINQAEKGAYEGEIKRLQESK
jgi:tetratricopeptide (TPR) repeat protein